MDDLSREEPSNSTILYRHTKHAKSAAAVLTRKHTHKQKQRGDAREKKRMSQAEERSEARRASFCSLMIGKKKEEKKKERCKPGREK